MWLDLVSLCFWGNVDCSFSCAALFLQNIRIGKKKIQVSESVCVMFIGSHFWFINLFALRTVAMLIIKTVSHWQQCHFNLQQQGKFPVFLYIKVVFFLSLHRQNCYGGLLVNRHASDTVIPDQNLPCQLAVSMADTARDRANALCHDYCTPLSINWMGNS